MIPVRLLPLRVTISRVSNTLLAGATLGFTAGVTRADEKAVLLEVTGTGLTGPVAVDITGSLDGVGQTETVNLTASLHVHRSLKRWTAVSQLASSSVSGGTVAVAAVFGDGQPAFAEQVVFTNVPVRTRSFQRSDPKLRALSPGTTLETGLWCYTNEIGIRTKDVIVLPSGRYEVQDAVPVYGRHKPHHMELPLKRLN